MVENKVKSLFSVIKNNFDVFYLIMAGIVLVLDILTINEIIEALAFILITIGFVFSVLPNKKNIKDERISYIKLFSGYMGFMVSIITISVFSVLIRYTHFSIETSDLLRYIGMLMYFFFSLFYALNKRKL